MIEISGELTKETLIVTPVVPTNPYIVDSVKLSLPSKNIGLINTSDDDRSYTWYGKLDSKRLPDEITEWMTLAGFHTDEHPWTTPRQYRLKYGRSGQEYSKIYANSPHEQRRIRLILKNPQCNFLRVDVFKDMKKASLAIDGKGPITTGFISKIQVSLPQTKFTTDQIRWIFGHHEYSWLRETDLDLFAQVLPEYFE